MIGRVAQGFQSGWGDAMKGGNYAKAAWAKVEDAQIPTNIPGKAGYAVGRVAGDLAGHGTQKITWNMHGLDLTETLAKSTIDKLGGNNTAKTLAGFGAAMGVGIGSGNLNPLNLGEMGRVAGFGATQPDEEDPRKTNNPALELVDRLILGRSGRLLPWEQFKEERPDVQYEEYEAYQKYQKDPGLLGLGLVKGTMDGIEGPEARFMGYKVTPEGAALGAAALGAVALGVKRLAALRK